MLLLLIIILNKSLKPSIKFMLTSWHETNCSVKSRFMSPDFRWIHTLHLLWFCYVSWKTAFPKLAWPYLLADLLHHVRVWFSSCLLPNGLCNSWILLPFHLQIWLKMVTESSYLVWGNGEIATVIKTAAFFNGTWPTLLVPQKYICLEIEIHNLFRDLSLVSSVLSVLLWTFVHSKWY